jgi:hypothetical protein
MRRLSAPLDDKRTALLSSGRTALDDFGETELVWLALGVASVALLSPGLALSPVGDVDEPAGAIAVVGG